SQSQKRFWFEEQLLPHNPALNVAVRWRLEGPVPHEHLEAAWRLLTARHEPLRTSFETIDGEPYQIVAPAVTLHIPLIDLTALPADDARREAERIAASEARRPVDFASSPLIRVTHLRVAERESIVLVTAHHTICDGWSVGVLAHEMGEALAALAAGRSPALAPLEATYADYVAWEQANLAEEAASGLARERLRALMAGVQPFELATDRPRAAEQSTNSGIVSHLLPRELSEAVAELGKRHGCTLFMTAYAVLLTLLARFSGEREIVVGTQVAGRDEVPFEALVGSFINTIALRAEVGGDPTFVELLERARDVVSDAFELRGVPLEQLIEIVNPKRDLSRHPLFAVNFIFQRSFIKNEDFGTFRLIDLPSRSAGPVYDLNFFMVERPEGWRASCEYNADLYEEATVQRMLDAFVRLLRAVSEDPERRLSALPVMDEDERERILAYARGPRNAYERDATVHEVFAKIAAGAADAVALVAGRETLTYAELEARSNRLARALARHGVASGATVGVCLERSPETIVAYLAILKLGAAYLPLDPNDPSPRLALLGSDAGARVVIAREAELAFGQGVTTIDQAAL
ncbi:MAG: condensation domain-containing protein, partial [Vulcanimicrobiaceae bacterium]